MTAEIALQNVEVICRQYTGYTLATARAVEESLAVLREAIAGSIEETRGKKKPDPPGPKSSLSPSHPPL